MFGASRSVPEHFGASGTFWIVLAIWSITTSSLLPYAAPIVSMGCLRRMVPSHLIISQIMMIVTTFSPGDIIVGRDASWHFVAGTSTSWTHFHLICILRFQLFSLSQRGCLKICHHVGNQHKMGPSGVWALLFKRHTLSFIATSICWIYFWASSWSPDGG